MGLQNWTMFCDFAMLRKSASEDPYDIYAVTGDQFYVVGLHTSLAGDAVTLIAGTGAQELEIARSSGADTTLWLDFPVSTKVIDATNAAERSLSADVDVASGGQVIFLFIKKGSSLHHWTEFPKFGVYQVTASTGSSPVDLDSVLPANAYAIGLYTETAGDEIFLDTLTADSEFQYCSGANTNVWFPYPLSMDVADIGTDTSLSVRYQATIGSGGRATIAYIVK